MKPGDPIRINDLSPWPTRAGCLGFVAEPPEDYGDRYPVAGLAATEVIVRLVDDPEALPDASWWSCVMPRIAVEPRP